MLHPTMRLCGHSLTFNGRSISETHIHSLPLNLWGIDLNLLTVKCLLAISGLSPKETLEGHYRFFVAVSSLSAQTFLIIIFIVLLKARVVKRLMNLFLFIRQKRKAVCYCRSLGEYLTHEKHAYIYFLFSF
jgi:hypothetical protein